MISKVIATGDDNTAINGICGAESDVAPVSSVTLGFKFPIAELQATHEKPLQRPILPPLDLQKISLKSPFL